MEFTFGLVYSNSGLYNRKKDYSNVEPNLFYHVYSNEINRLLVRKKKFFKGLSHVLVKTKSKVKQRL